MRRNQTWITALLTATSLSATLSGCVVSQPASAPAATPTSTTSVAAPTTTPAPATVEQPSAEELQSQAVEKLVKENGQTACDVLALKPTTDVNELVDLVLSTYGVESMDAETQRVLVVTFMTESAAAYCPEQSDRVSTDLNLD